MNLCFVIVSLQSHSYNTFLGQWLGWSGNCWSLQGVAASSCTLCSAATRPSSASRTPRFSPRCRRGQAPRREGVVQGSWPRASLRDVVVCVCDDHDRDRYPINIQSYTHRMIHAGDRVVLVLCDLQTVVAFPRARNCTGCLNLRSQFWFAEFQVLKGMFPWKCISRYVSHFSVHSWFAESANSESRTKRAWLKQLLAS